MVVLLLVACGGGGGTSDADKTATARTANANDAATVTAFAGGRGSSAGSSSTASPATNAAGGKGGFVFATFPSGSSGRPSPTVRSATGGASAAGTPRVTGTPAGLVGNLYTDPKGRFMLTVPQGWRVQQTGSSGVDFQAAAPAALRGGFQIAAEDIGTAITLDDYATSAMDSFMQATASYQSVQGGIQATTIAGMPARQFEFTGQNGTSNVHAAVFVVKKGTTAYAFLIAAAPEDFDAVFAQAKQFIDSFVFL